MTSRQIQVYRNCRNCVHNLNTKYLDTRRQDTTYGPDKIIWFHGYP